MASPGEEAVGTTYEILVKGELSEGLVSDIGARSFEVSRGKTMLVLDIIDQSHLHGVLSWLRDHNIVIERVNPV